MSDLSTSALLLALALLLICGLCALRRRCASRKRGRDSADLDDEDDEVFYSAQSEFDDERESLRAPLVSSTSHSINCREGWTRREHRAVDNFLAALTPGVEQPPAHMMLQAVWARKLDSTAAAELWERHLQAAERVGVSGVSDAQVRDAYAQGFAVRSGKDLDGRPMMWVRMGLCDPTPLTPPVVVCNTWMALDAVLSQSDQAARQGVCLVYDLSEVRMRQVNAAIRAGWMNPVWVHQSLWAGPAQPALIARVWLLDAPRIFVKLWNMFSYILPSYITEVVRWESTIRRGRSAAERFSDICRPEELPVYVGGDPARFGEPFVEWMFRLLDGRPLVYRRRSSTATEGAV